MSAILPQSVSSLGEDADKEVSGLVGSVCGRHDDVVPWVQVQLPPHTPERHMKELVTSTVFLSLHEDDFSILTNIITALIIRHWIMFTEFQFNSLMAFYLY